MNYFPKLRISCGYRLCPRSFSQVHGKNCKRLRNISRIVPVLSAGEGKKARNSRTKTKFRSFRVFDGLIEMGKLLFFSQKRQKSRGIAVRETRLEVFEKPWDTTHGRARDYDDTRRFLEKHCTSIKTYEMGNWTSSGTKLKVAGVG